MSQRRQALLDVFDEFEEMALLFSSIPRSPAMWEEEDDDVNDLREGLVAKGFLEQDGYYYTTTRAGRDALIAYINECNDQDESD